MKETEKKKTKDDEVNGQGEKGRVPRPHMGHSQGEYCGRIH